MHAREVEEHLTLAVCWLRGSFGICGGVEGTWPAAGLTPLRLVEALRTQCALASFALPEVTALAWHWNGKGWSEWRTTRALLN
jgi:hypothetical protein